MKKGRAVVSVDEIKNFVLEHNFSINVKVVPGSRTDDISIEGDVLRIKIREIAENNRANVAVVALLGKLLNVPSDNIRIVRGLRGRTKLIAVLKGYM